MPAPALSASSVSPSSNARGSGRARSSPVHERPESVAASSLTSAFSAAVTVLVAASIATLATRAGALQARNSVAPITRCPAGPGCTRSGTICRARSGLSVITAAIPALTGSRKSTTVAFSFAPSVVT